MEPSHPDSHAERRANELYWGSDSSVNQIAAELDLSKSALYGIIRPHTTDLGCPLCGAQVVFPNRTARQRDRLTCGSCEWQGSHEEAVADDGGTRDRAAGPPEGSALTSLPSGRFPGRSLAGGALLGAAAGLALVLWARRR